MENDYRQVLRQQLDVRKIRNPAYSLRAFARDLGVSPSRLSEVVSSRQRLSPALALKIADRLCLPASERTHFLDLVQVEADPESTTGKKAQVRLAKHFKKTAAQDLSERQIAVLTSWKHLAILEAVTQEPQTTGELAVRFGFDATETAELVAALRGLRLVKKNPGTSAWIRSQQDVYCGGTVPSIAIRRMHQEAMSKAQTALHFQAFEKRAFNTLILSLPEARRSEAMARLHEFVRDFNAEFSVSEPDAQVYALTLQFFSMEADLEHH